MTANILIGLGFGVGYALVNHTRRCIADNADTAPDAIPLDNLGD